MSRKLWQSGGILLTALLGAACTTMGSGVGETSGGGPGVNFSWRAENAIKGQMTATLSTGEAYMGNLFQITSDTRVDQVGPLWEGWRGRRGWGGWGYWDAGPEFVTHYTGRVLANLSSPNGDHMRCNFRLIEPDRGMAGGGEGQCQLTAGQTIDATFPAV